MLRSPWSLVKCLHRSGFRGLLGLPGRSQHHEQFQIETAHPQTNLPRGKPFARMLNVGDRGPKQMAEEHTPTGQMTIGEMLQRYPKAQVEKAIFDFNFSLHRAQTIKRYQDSIARGVNVDLCQQWLREIEDTLPPGPPVDPDEPQHLDAAVLWRIKLLKYEYGNGPPLPAVPGLEPEDDIRNVDAVLSAYRQGELRVHRDKVTVWFAGEMVLGPRPREGLWDKIRAEQQAWIEEYGNSRPWVEDVVPARAKSTTTNHL